MTNTAEETITEGRQLVSQNTRHIQDWEAPQMLKGRGQMSD